MKIDHGIKRIINLCLLVLTTYTASAQFGGSKLHYSIESQGIYTPPGKLPFWLRADNYGSIPLSGFSSSLIGSVYKDYDSISKHSFNWSAGIQVRGNAGDKAYFSLIEGFVKIKKGVFRLQLGRTKDITGIVDSTLSTGAFSVSGNALGIPKIELSIPEYCTLPFFNKLFAIKGGYAFGFFGSTKLGFSYAKIPQASEYLQQESLYIRLGHEDWKLKLFGGINHQVMFGHEREIYGSLYAMSSIRSAIYAAIGKNYYSSDHQFDDLYGGKIGNHVGSIDLSAQYELNTVRLMGYQQFIYDIGAIAHLDNVADGITGLSITNKSIKKKGFNWSKILFEFVHTKNQAGAQGLKAPSGDEDYYNDYEFNDGWTYHELNLGNPLLTSREYTRAGLISDPDDFIIDNRVIAYHTGLQGSLNSIAFTLKLTYSQNYGTYGTNYPGHSTNFVFTPPKYGIFKPVDQFSTYLGIDKSLKDQFTIGMAIAADKGDLYYNSVGVILKLKKDFR